MDDLKDPLALAFRGRGEEMDKEWNSVQPQPRDLLMPQSSSSEPCLESSLSAQGLGSRHVSLGRQPPPSHPTNKSLHLQPRTPSTLQLTSDPIATIYQLQPVDGEPQGFQITYGGNSLFLSATQLSLVNTSSGRLGSKIAPAPRWGRRDEAG